MTVIRSAAPIILTVHHPQTAASREELARRVSDVHASAITQHINSLSCPTKQKSDLLDAVIETAKERSKDQV